MPGEDRLCFESYRFVNWDGLQVSSVLGLYFMILQLHKRLQRCFIAQSDLILTYYIGNQLV